MNHILPRGSWYVTVPLLVLGTCYYFWMFAPRARDIARLRTELRAVGRSIDDACHLAAEVPAAEKQRHTTQQYVEQWRARMNRHDQVAKAFAQISQMADRAGVTTTRLTPQAELAQQTLVRVPVDLQFSGPWANCLSFLQQLEGANQVIWVEDLSLSEAGQAGQDLLGELKLVIFADQSDFSG